MSLVVGLAGAFVAVGLMVRRLDMGVYLLLGMLAGIGSAMFAVSYFYL